jgi:hypothetical protein
MSQISLARAYARPSTVLVLAALFLAACGGGGSSPSPSPPPPPPTITQLNPASVVAGSAAFALSVSGTGFLQSATVSWNGTPLATTWNSSTNLSAVVPATQLADSANIAVTVVTFTGTGFTPTSRLTEVDPCNIVNAPTFVSATQLTIQIQTTQAPSKCWNPGSTSLYSFDVQDSSGMSPPSNTLTISVTPAIPVASAVMPATVPALQGALAVTVTGDFLSSTSTVYFNGSARPTTVVNNGVQLI